MPAFRSWPDALPESIELRVVQLPGRGLRLREPAFQRMEPLIAALGGAIRPLLDRPFAFFGHSLGALVAFELARHLRESKLEPVQLFVSGRTAPQLPDRNPRIHNLGRAALLHEIRILNGIPRGVLDSEELLEVVLPIIRADFTVLEHYVHAPEPPLRHPITAFGGLNDPRTTVEGLDAWREQTSGGFEIRMLPGDHFFVDTARASLVDAVVQSLSARM